MKHSELVVIAEKWLRNTIGCRVVLCEHVAYTVSGEVPDAIGWKAGQCFLVECKTSRKDFFADRKKRSRSDHNAALGDWRFYLTPEGLVLPEEVPSSWGLYEVRGARVVFVSGAKYSNRARPVFRSCKQSEIAMLVSALAKMLTNS